MRIAVVGGGPAGLFFALLMARHGDHQVAVFERNPPDATYGWGVVFSEGTLAELRDADRETHTAITDRFVRWGAIDIRLRDRVIRSLGQGFSAISRRALLKVLQERSRRLGVDLRFGSEVGSPQELSDYDLVVAADGINSTIRSAHEVAFGPRRDRHATRYAWFGADLPLDAFTFIFEETPHGLFQVHAYPFDARQSTFIVECAEPVWRAAGLDVMGQEESLAFCEKVFDRHLAGNRLLSNRSEWVQFVTLRTATWHHRNVVLMGDAAHTAHFSIGSGTKLAMEDAVALHAALTDHPGDLAAAFAAYELERHPVVERFQQAARESARYFEEVARYLGLEPVRFAFNLLTRSGRVTHLSMEQRDPALTAAADRAVSGPDRLIPPPPRLAPLRLRSAILPNRIVLAAADVTGLPAAANWGAGLVLTPEVAVAPEGRIGVESSRLDQQGGLEEWRRLVGSAKTVTEVRLGVVLSHAGRRGATRPRERGVDRPLASGGWPLLAASALPYTPRSAIPRAIGQEGMKLVEQQFAVAASRAAAAGFDLAMVDLAGGYLLGGFVSPLTNRRDDRYGGSPDNRLRFPLQVFAAVRRVWPEGSPVAARISATDWHHDGTTEDEAVAIAAGLAAAGCDLIEVCGGGTIPDAAPDYRRLYLISLADRIRNEARIPVLARGGITTLDDIDTLVAAGRADLCLLDPYRYRRTTAGLT